MSLDRAIAKISGGPGDCYRMPVTRDLPDGPANGIPCRDGAHALSLTRGRCGGVGRSNPQPLIRRQELGGLVAESERELSQPTVQHQFLGREQLRTGGLVVHLHPDLMMSHAAKLDVATSDEQQDGREAKLIEHEFLQVNRTLPGQHAWERL